MENGVSYSALDFDTDERFTRLRHQLGVSTFGMNQLVLKPGQRSRIHRHERQEEVYVVLAGELTLAIENEERRLGRGEIARVAPDVRRQLINHGPERLVVLALGGALEHDGRDGQAFLSWEDTEPRSPADVPFPDEAPAAG